MITKRELYILWCMIVSVWQIYIHTLVSLKQPRLLTNIHDLHAHNTLHITHISSKCDHRSLRTTVANCYYYIE